MRGDGTGRVATCFPALSSQRPLRCAGSFPRRRRCRGRPCLCPGPAERQPRVGRAPHLPFCEWERCGRRGYGGGAPGLRRGSPRAAPLRPRVWDAGLCRAGRRDPAQRPRPVPAGSLTSGRSHGVVEAVEACGPHRAPDPSTHPQRVTLFCACVRVTGPAWAPTGVFNFVCVRDLVGARRAGDL